MSTPRRSFLQLLTFGAFEATTMQIARVPTPTTITSLPETVYIVLAQSYDHDDECYHYSEGSQLTGVYLSEAAAQAHADRFNVCDLRTTDNLDNFVHGKLSENMDEDMWPTYVELMQNIWRKSAATAEIPDEEWLEDNIEFPDDASDEDLLAAYAMLPFTLYYVGEAKVTELSPMQLADVQKQLETTSA